MDKKLIISFAIFLFSLACSGFLFLQPVFGTDSKVIKVDISKQKIELWEENDLIKEYDISSGATGSPTPTGNFKIYNKEPMTFSERYDCWLPFWLAFTPDSKYGFHELPICLVSNEAERKGMDSLGENSSNGCVRMGIGDAQDLYQWAEIGTKVIIFREEEEEAENNGSWCYSFKRNLWLGSRGEDVRFLQAALKEEGVFPEEQALSGWFGPVTQGAVRDFQMKYKEDILIPWGFSQGTGFVGLTTKSKLNLIYDCQK